MPDRYSEAELKAIRAAHMEGVIGDGHDEWMRHAEPRWLATLDAIKAERDRAIEALRFYAERGTYQQSHGPGCGVDGDGDEHHESSCGEPDIVRDCGEKARTALAAAKKEEA